MVNGERRYRYRREDDYEDHGDYHRPRIPLRMHRRKHPLSGKGGFFGGMLVAGGLALLDPAVGLLFAGAVVIAAVLSMIFFRGSDIDLD